jgi:flagellar protein FlaG
MKIQGMEAAANIRLNSDPQANAGRVDIPQMRTRQETMPQQKSIGSSEYPINEKVVSEAVEKINKALEGTNRRFEYSVHEGTNDIMIKVIDESTKEVVREIPPKKILDMVASMMEMAGLLVDERR